ncbi:MAG: GreA/GreB family elongation factor [Victivallales bacterium]|nr:GreA/GreB family elongation factor [Victivallales bacterium]MCF7888492.1 GreA/GreB family elongation factor [Victivallales bacterium]
MSSVNKIEELLLETASSENNELYDEIIKLFDTVPTPIPQNICDALGFIIESWQIEPDNSQNKTEFLLKVTSFFKNEFSALRSALPSIIKKSLPKGYNKATTIKALGVRDSNIPLCKIYKNYLKLVSLKDSKIYFSDNSDSWGRTGKIDWIAGAIRITNFQETECSEIDLKIALNQMLLFNHSEELIRLIIKKDIISFHDARTLLEKNSITQLSSDDIRNALFYIYIPKKMTPKEFQDWKKGSAAAGNSIPKIQSVRSIRELKQVLMQNKEIQSITESELDKIKIVLEQVKPKSPYSDYLLWAETVCLLRKILTQDQLGKIIPENKRVLEMLWPENNTTSDIPGIKVWTQMKIQTLNAWAEFTKTAKGEDYLIELCTILPWRAWPTIISKVEKNKFTGIIESSKRISSPEALLWIWKNKATLPDSVTEKINTVNLFAALGRKKQGAVWNTAKKELKKLILENTNFQMSLIKDKNSESHIVDFLERLNNLSTFSKNEKQSIIVKLSRQFTTMKSLFNTGKAKDLLSSQNTEDIEETDNTEQHITSKKSYNARLSELDEIINVLVPENTKAIATAREHGDLRENAEYAAAKERQKYLNERRVDLEYGIMTTVPTDFSNIKVNNRIVAGCSVVLESEKGEKETYHILGAWDSDPSKNYVSYDTGLGKALVGKKTNDKVILPDGSKYTVLEINSLSKKIIKDID